MISFPKPYSLAGIALLLAIISSTFSQPSSLNHLLVTPVTVPLAKVTSVNTGTIQVSCGAIIGLIDPTHGFPLPYASVIEADCSNRSKITIDPVVFLLDTVVYLLALLGLAKLLKNKFTSKTQ